jgi:hypothetical protein
MRPGLIAVITGALLVGVSSSAYGAKPERGPEGPVDVTFPAGAVCPSFAVRIQSDSRGWVNTFSSGKVQITGYERATVTNLSNTAQIELIANGRVALSPREDGRLDLEITGPQIVFFFPGDAGPGDQSTGRTYYFKGHVRVVTDETFTFYEFTFSGTSIDLCAALS